MIKKKYLFLNNKPSHKYALTSSIGVMLKYALRKCFKNLLIVNEDSNN